MGTKGVWVNSQDYISKFSECFPAYPKNRLIFSRIGVNQQIFYPRACEVRSSLGKHVHSWDKARLQGISRAVVFVGKFADWKRLDAVLYAAAMYESTFVDLATVVVGTGPDEEVSKYVDLAKKL